MSVEGATGVDAARRAVEGATVLKREVVLELAALQHEANHVTHRACADRKKYS